MFRVDSTFMSSFSRLTRSIDTQSFKRVELTMNIPIFIVEILWISPVVGESELKNLRRILLYHVNEVLDVIKHNREHNIYFLLPGDCNRPTNEMCLSLVTEITKCSIDRKCWYNIKCKNGKTYSDAGALEIEPQPRTEEKVYSQLKRSFCLQKLSSLGE